MGTGQRFDGQYALEFHCDLIGYDSLNLISNKRGPGIGSDRRRAHASRASSKSPSTDDCKSERESMTRRNRLKRYGNASRDRNLQSCCWDRCLHADIYICRRAPMSVHTTATRAVCSPSLKPMQSPSATRQACRLAANMNLRCANQGCAGASSKGLDTMSRGTGQTCESQGGWHESILGVGGAREKSEVMEAFLLLLLLRSSDVTGFLLLSRDV